MKVSVRSCELKKTKRPPSRRLRGRGRVGAAKGRLSPLYGIGWKFAVHWAIKRVPDCRASLWSAPACLCCCMTATTASDVAPARWRSALFQKREQAPALHTLTRAAWPAAQNDGKLLACAGL